MWEKVYIFLFIKETADSKEDVKLSSDCHVLPKKVGKEAGEYVFLRI